MCFQCVIFFLLYCHCAIYYIVLQRHFYRVKCTTVSKQRGLLSLWRLAGMTFAGWIISLGYLTWTRWKLFICGAINMLPSQTLTQMCSVWKTNRGTIIALDITSNLEEFDQIALWELWNDNFMTLSWLHMSVMASHISSQLDHLLNNLLRLITKIIFKLSS